MPFASSHGTFQMLLGDKTALDPGDVPSPPPQEPCSSEPLASPASVAPEPPCQRPGPLAVFCVRSLPGRALKPRPAYPVDSSPSEVPVRRGLGLAMTARAADSLEAAGESLRGRRRVAGVSEGLGAVTERADGSVRTMAGGEGRLVAVWAPDEDSGSGVTGGGPGAPGAARGRVEALGRIKGPGEGWEAPGSPGNVPPDPGWGEGEAWSPEGLVGRVCVVVTFVLRRSWRTWGTGLSGNAAGGPGHELQFTRASVSPRGLRAALPDSTALLSRESREKRRNQDAHWFSGRPRRLWDELPWGRRPLTPGKDQLAPASRERPKGNLQ